MAESLPILRQRFFDSNGDPLSGGMLYSYIAGTSTPSATYADSAGVTPNANPIVLDANGEANVFITAGGGSYKFVLTDSEDVIQWTVDDVSVSSDEVASNWSEHEIADGQAAADLEGETINLAAYSTAIYDVEIIRGTTVSAYGQIAVQNVNGTGRLSTGLFLAQEAHGVTFSISQTLLVAQLRAATTSGPGAGTIKLSRRLVPV